MQACKPPATYICTYLMRWHRITVHACTYICTYASMPVLYRSLAAPGRPPENKRADRLCFVQVKKTLIEVVPNGKMSWASNASPSFRSLASSACPAPCPHKESKTMSSFHVRLMYASCHAWCHASSCHRIREQCCALVDKVKNRQPSVAIEASAAATLWDLWGCTVSVPLRAYSCCSSSSHLPIQDMVL